MKKEIVVFILALCLVLPMSYQAPQQQPLLTVGLTQQEWNMVVTMIHSSESPGSMRDPIIQKITQQCNAQIRYMDSVAKSRVPDTLKPKKKS